MIRKIFSFRRSLLFQLISLSLVVFLFLALQIIIEPLLERMDERDSRRITSSILYSTIQSKLMAGDVDFSGFDQSDLIQKITAVNPDFRYYIQANGIEHKYGGEPKRISYHQAGYYELVNTTGRERCLISSRGVNFFSEKSSYGVAAHDNCPVYAYYFEIAGIEQPLNDNVGIAKLMLEEFNLYTYKKYFIGILLIIVFSMYVMFNALRSIRKIALATRKVDLTKHRERIDTDGLPLEILPMAKAFNAMIARLEKSYNKNRFFLAAAAHEIRTPLTIMRMKLEEADSTSLKKEINQMSSLVENLLKLTKYQSDEDISLSEVELNGLVRDVCASRVPLALKRGVEIELNAKASSVSVVGERQLIETALVNILDNAISFSKQGCLVSITVLESKSVQIKDQGPGINSEDLSYVFEPFSKKPPNRHGHGLGLAIVKAIMELHGGKVSCRSKPSTGAEFTLSFK